MNRIKEKKILLTYTTLPVELNKKDLINQFNINFKNDIVLDIIIINNNDNKTLIFLKLLSILDTTKKLIFQLNYINGLSFNPLLIKSLNNKDSKIYENDLINNKLIEPININLPS